MHNASLLTRLRARAGGEIPADALEAYRRASLPVLELLDSVEAARRLGGSPWSLGHGEQTRMVCAWNAFVLQQLGTGLLEADYEANPGTVGFVPPVTSQQVIAFFAPIEEWLGRAQRVACDPNTGIDGLLPAALPRWSSKGPHPTTHLCGILDAMEAISDHARTAVAFFGGDPPSDPDHARQFHTIRGLFATADAKARYAEDLYGADPTPAVDNLAGPTIREALELLHRVGQFAAMPRLADMSHSPDASSGTSSHPPPVQPPNRRLSTPVLLPGDPRFDLWCLTDRRVRHELQDDPEARQALERLWRYDPDPQATIKLRKEIQDAEIRGFIEEAMDGDGRRLGQFSHCPWPTIYQVVHGVTISGQRLMGHQRFILAVSADGIEIGHPFRRGIHVAEFRATDEFHYGDPLKTPSY